ncbi:MAG: homoserine O-succinyltransferase [Candidatus Acidiferrum sp.]
MPLIMDRKRTPTHWAERGSSSPLASDGSYAGRAERLELAFINNMPDAALEDTESQFFGLLDAAAESIPVHLRLYSLPHIPRSERAQQHLSNFYRGIDDLLSGPCDAVVMTGTEPHHPSLRNEPYWGALVDVLDWAEHNTVSTILSCLAAHAGVLHSDGIDRHRLNDKQFGVFEESKISGHALLSQTSELMPFPHSRWNEVREDALISCGYTVLTKSAEAGVNLFVKKKKKSLFVHFQGHPEYGADTLFKEYRRDVKRYLRGERETYPSMPYGYFNRGTIELLTSFREKALSHRGEEPLAAFPNALAIDPLESRWHSSAERIYANWLQYVASRKAEAPAFAEVARVGCETFRDHIE